MDFKYVVNSAAGKARHFTKTAVKKTGEAAEYAKLQVAFISEKRKLERMFSTLGKLFYEQVKGTDVRVQIAAQIMEIDEQKAVIKDLKRAIYEAKIRKAPAGYDTEVCTDDLCCDEPAEAEAEASEDLPEVSAEVEASEEDTADTAEE